MHTFAHNGLLVTVDLPASSPVIAQIDDVLSKAIYEGSEADPIYGDADAERAERYLQTGFRGATVRIASEGHWAVTSGLRRQPAHLTRAEHDPWDYIRSQFPCHPKQMAHGKVLSAEPEFFEQRCPDCAQLWRITRRRAWFLWEDIESLTDPDHEPTEPLDGFAVIERLEREGRRIAA